MGKDGQSKMTVLAISGLMLFPQGERRGYMAAYLGMRAYVEAGHRVHFLTCWPPLEHYEGQEARAARDRIEDGIHVHEFHVPWVERLSRFRRAKLPANKFLHYLIYLFQILLCEYVIWGLFTAGAVVAGIRIARRVKPDVIYGFHIGNAAGWVVSRRYGVPLITRVFGTFLYSLLSTRFYKFRYFTSVTAFTVPCDCLIILDDGTRGDYVAEVLRVPKARVRFWRDGIHPSMLEKPKEIVDLRARWNIPEKNKIILTLGRMWLVKGFHKLIRAVPRMVQQYQDVTVLMVGDGGEREFLEKMVRDFSVDQWVKFPGSLAHDEVKSCMYLADVFVQLCDISNLTNVLIEALSCRRCVVTLDDGSTKGLITDGETGFLAPPGDDHALADTVVRLLRDDSLRRRVGEAAGQHVAQQLLTWDRRNQMEIDLVQDLVSHSKS
ncbi:MAG: glycosyltransferase family 4 protein [Acidobacteria bacterium]|nr:glycosyltransferase family 4 protein [Acidobacteriota bacterium]MBI3655263.1 glycosyltransferase family 4 protein [Acidobacteriota bacterium]